MNWFRVTMRSLSLLVIFILVGHVILLASDSEQYRQWVFIQMALLSVGAMLIWQIGNFRRSALIAAGLLALPIGYINSVYLNYGNGGAAFAVEILVLLVVGACCWHARLGFASKSSGVDV